MNPGDLVGTNFKLLRPLGAGGMGAVWLARNLSLDADVAIKFIVGEFAQDEAIRSRFKREAAMAARVRSPHIVQVYDHGVTPEGAAYIVMELLEGEELAARLARDSVLPPGAVVSIIHQASKGLARAHQAGIVHRDIKPSNIFLVQSEDEEVFVKVVDFGIAKIEVNDAPSSMTATGAVLGTPYYMSPEQIVSSKTTDLRTDLWSLAVVAYECLTGQLPFTGESVGGLWIAINNADFVPPSKLRPGLPTSVDTWFSKALAKARQERFQSAREFSDAFRAAVPDVLVEVEEENTAQFPIVSVPPPAPRASEFEATAAPLSVLAARESSDAPAVSAPVAIAQPQPVSDPPVVPAKRSTKALGLGAAAAALVVGGGAFALRSSNQDAVVPPPSTITTVSSSPVQKVDPTAPAALSALPVAAALPTATTSLPAPSASPGGIALKSIKGTAHPTASARATVTAVVPAPKPSSKDRGF